MKPRLSLHRKWAFAGLFLTLSCAFGYADAELRGRITDALTGASLSGALVTLDPNDTVQGDELTTLSDPGAGIRLWHHSK